MEWPRVERVVGRVNSSDANRLRRMLTASEARCNNDPASPTSLPRRWCPGSNSDYPQNQVATVATWFCRLVAESVRGGGRVATAIVPGGPALVYRRPTARSDT